MLREAHRRRSSQEVCVKKGKQAQQHAPQAQIHRRPKAGDKDERFEQPARDVRQKNVLKFLLLYRLATSFPCPLKGKVGRR